MLLKYKHLLFFLLIPCLFLASCNKDDDNDNDEMEMEEQVIYDYIGFTFNGTEYSGLKPNIFSSTIADIEHFSSSDTDALQLIAAHSDIELQFYIHENLWEEGTYNILEDDFQTYDPNNVKLAIYITGSGDFRAEVDSGSLTITEFNREDRVINATFELSYVLDDWDGTVEGPFGITNGTINIPLDHEYFD